MKNEDRTKYNFIQDFKVYHGTPDMTFDNEQ